MASKTESLAMCKTGHEHAANKETHKPRVHTSEKHKLRATQNKTKLEKVKRKQRKHAPTARPNLERECPNPDTKPELGLKQDKSAGIRTPRSNMKQSTWTKERAARAPSKPHAHQKTRQEGSVRALSQNHD